MAEFEFVQVKITFVKVVEIAGVLSRPNKNGRSQNSGLSRIVAFSSSKISIAAAPDQASIHHITGKFGEYYIWRRSHLNLLGSF